MKVKTLQFGGMCATDPVLLSKENRSNVPGLTRKEIKGIQVVDYAPVSMDAIRQSSLFLVEFKDISTNEDLYLVVKSRYELPWQFEVVKKAFVNFAIEQVYGDEQPKVVEYHSQRIIDEVERVREYWHSIYLEENIGESRVLSNKVDCQLCIHHNSTGEGIVVKNIKSRNK